MDRLDHFAIPTAVAAATRVALLRLQQLSRHDAQTIAYPELFRDY